MVGIRQVVLVAAIVRAVGRTIRKEVVRVKIRPKRRQTKTERDRRNEGRFRGVETEALSGSRVLDVAGECDASQR